MATELKLKIGKNKQDGSDYELNLTKAPHVLVGGTTGSGKSVLLHTIISQLVNIMSYQGLNLYLGDPKLVEFSLYERCSQVRMVSNSVAEHDQMLSEIIKIMDNRFQWMKEGGIKNLVGHFLCPNIVVVLDEFGDLVLDKKFGPIVTEKIVKIIQLGRAAAITVILATQHPIVQVVDTRIKANCPTRIALKVSSAVNSRVVIDEAGAERLNGCGHMLVMSPYASELAEVQGTFFSERELKDMVKKGAEQFGYTIWSDEDQDKVKVPWR